MKHFDNSDDLIEKYVAVNYEYYERKWNSMDERNSKFSLNLPALLFLPFWLAFRKMYLNLIIYTALLFGLGLIEWLAEFKIPNSTYMGFSVVIGLMANGIYRDFVKKKIRRIMESDSANDVEQVIKKKGGTSIAAVLLVLCITVVSLIIVIVDIINNCSAM